MNEITGSMKKSKVWQFFKELDDSRFKCLVTNNVTEQVCCSIVRKTSVHMHMQNHHREQLMTLEGNHQKISSIEKQEKIGMT